MFGEEKMYKQLTPLKRWLILFNVALSVFMATLDGSIVNIALPVLSKELSVNINSIQWVVTSYILTISVLLPIWGKISDIYGRKKIFATGFIVFTIGSAMCSFSRSLDLLVVSRILQAMGASSMMALSQGIVTTVFPPEERGKALGITGTTVAIGSLVGPSLGGILVHAAGWQSIFLINIPIGIIGTLLTLVLIPESVSADAPSGFDYKGSFLFIVSVVVLFLDLLFYQEGNIRPAFFVPILFLAVILIFIFIHFERKLENPLINLSFFKNRIFSIGVSSAFLSFVAINSAILFLPFYLQLVLKLSTIEAGLLMSFYPIATAVIAPLSGWLSDKISYRPLTVTGLTISTISLVGLSFLTEASPRHFFILLMLLLGTGTAIFQSPNNSSVMGSVPHSQLGIAGGINALFRNLGMVSGITLSVSLFTLTTKMNVNNISGAASAVDIPVFLKGLRIVLLAASLSTLAAAGLSLVRAISHRKNSDT